VDLDVAETVRVTDKPKKLNPLRSVRTKGLYSCESGETYPMLNIIRMLETQIPL
jgi:hypothetical protein